MHMLVLDAHAESSNLLNCCS